MASIAPDEPPIARHHYPGLERLAHAYRVGAWISLVAGPLIIVMSLSSSLEAVGRLLWIVLVLVATAFIFVTWRATSELILAMLQINEVATRTEQRTRGLEDQVDDMRAAMTTPAKILSPRRRRTKRSKIERGARQSRDEETARESA